MEENPITTIDVEMFFNFQHKGLIIVYKTASSAIAIVRDMICSWIEVKIFP
jgi:hypothetical protein